MTIAQHAQFAHDLGNSVVSAVKVWAADPTPTTTDVPAPTFNSSGLIDFMTTKIAPILLAGLGVVFISRAGKGEMSKVLTSSAIAVIGLGCIAGATALFLFGRNLVNLILPPP